MKPILFTVFAVAGFVVLFFFVPLPYDSNECNALNGTADRLRTSAVSQVELEIFGYTRAPSFMAEQQGQEWTEIEFVQVQTIIGGPIEEGGLASFFTFGVESERHYVACTLSCECQYGVEFDPPIATFGTNGQD